MKAIGPEGKGGLYKSDDAGLTWKLVNNENRIWGRGWYFGNVAVDPVNPDRVYVINTATYMSTDAGKTFVPVKGAPGGDDYHQLWINPKDHNRMVLSSDQGTVVSVDGAKTWSTWYNQPTAQVYHVAADNRFPYWLYGAQQDSGAVSVSTWSPEGVLTFRDWKPICLAGESNTVVARSKGCEVSFRRRQPLRSRFEHDFAERSVARFRSKRSESQNLDITHRLLRRRPRRLLLEPICHAVSRFWPELGKDQSGFIACQPAGAGQSGPNYG